MKKFILQFFLLTFFLFAFISCKKNDTDSDTTPPVLTCLLNKVHYFDGAANPSDSLTYTYINGKINKMTNDSGYATFEYVNDRIIKRNFFKGISTSADAFDAIAYLADGSIVSIKTYSLGSGTPFLLAQYDFTYTDGKLSYLYIQKYDAYRGQFRLNSSSTFTYTDNNITQSITTYYNPVGGFNDILTLNYSYDSNANYFAKTNAIFTDYSFLDELDGSNIPLLISANNVTKAFDGTDEKLIRYTTDTKNNFYEFYFDGELVSRYLYDCK